MTSPEARRQIAIKDFVEHFNRMANMSPEERKQIDENFKKRQEEWNKERPPTELTTQYVLQSISYLKENPTKPPIKIVSTPEHLEWAKDLAKIFHLSGYELLTSREAIDNIFPAKEKHDKFIIRFRAKDEQLLGDKQEFDEEEYRKRHEERDRYSGCLSTVQAIVLIDFELTKFDSSDSRDYFQIEIKGAP